MSSAYEGCENLNVTAADIPLLGQVSSTAEMFMSCSSLTTISGMNDWDVSQVNNMNSLFRYAANFNEPIGDWDVSQVTDMEGMFHSTSRFNQFIGSWNVGKVTNMKTMFFQAKLFNQPIGGWDVKNVTNMSAMFYAASAFDQPLQSWNVGQVINMSQMFYFTSGFNQPLTNWNISNVKDMSTMFHSAAKFNQPLGEWNLNAVTTMANMLTNSGMDSASMALSLMGWAANTATPSDISFDAVNRNYGQQAAPARAILENSRNWKIRMGFETTCSLPDTPYITIWKTDNPGASASNQITIPANGSNYSIAWQQVGNPSNSGTAKGSGFYTLTFPSAGTYQVSITPGTGSFDAVNFLRTSDASKLLEIKQWGNTRWSSMETAYYGCSNLTVTAMDIPNLQSIRSTAYMFYNCSALTTVPEMDSWNLQSVTSMISMFNGAANFNQPIGSWNVSEVTSMQAMFNTAGKFNQPIGAGTPVR